MVKSLDPTAITVVRASGGITPFNDGDNGRGADEADHPDYVDFNDGHDSLGDNDRHVHD